MDNWPAFDHCDWCAKVTQCWPCRSMGSNYWLCERCLAKKYRGPPLNWFGCLILAVICIAVWVFVYLLISWFSESGHIQLRDALQKWLEIKP